jgi:MMP 1-O-methyltransferase
MNKQEFLVNLETITGYFTQNEALLARDLASSCIGVGCIVEIGSYQGRSTYALSVGAFEGGKDIAVYSVDINHGKENCKNFPGTVARMGMTNVITIPGASIDIARPWGIPVELVFIDGSHDYQDVLNDYHAWFPHVIHGGIVAFHDISPGWPGPTKAFIEEVIGNVGSLYSSHGSADSLHYAVKV